MVGKMVRARRGPANLTTDLVDKHISETRGNQNALRYRDKRYSYHDVAALMNRAGNMFRTVGVQKGQRILILVPPSPAHIASVLGAMKIGAIPVICDGEVNTSAVRQCLDSNPVVAVVVNDDQMSKLAGALEGLDQVIIVGENVEPQRSFVALVREAPSSLRGEPVDEGAIVLEVLNAGELKTLSQEELGRVLMKGGADTVGSEHLVNTLKSLVECEEITI